MARFGGLGEQYFDNSGKPLSAGKIFFFESDTTTDKDTFQNAGLSIDNTNPVILDAFGRQGDIFFDGSARAILTDSAGVQIDAGDPFGGDLAIGEFADWNSITIYNAPNIVTASDDNFYVSLTNGNQNNDPTLDAVNWSRIKFIGVYNVNETYSIGDPAQASDGLVYISLTDDNLGNDPTSDISNWGPSSSGSIPDNVTASSVLYNYENLGGFN